MSDADVKLKASGYKDGVPVPYLEFGIFAAIAVMIAFLLGAYFNQFLDLPARLKLTSQPLIGPRVVFYNTHSPESVGYFLATLISFVLFVVAMFFLTASRVVSSEEEAKQVGYRKPKAPIIGGALCVVFSLWFLFFIPPDPSDRLAAFFVFPLLPFSSVLAGGTFSAIAVPMKPLFRKVRGIS